MTLAQIVELRGPSRDSRMNSICIYTPSAHGGHALYTRELMTALSRYASDDVRFELITSEDLYDEFRTDAYPIHTILPKLQPKDEYSSTATWVFNRLFHYPKRELKLLNWIKTRPDVVAIHFQEYKPWIAAPLFKRLKADGRKIFYTVHNLRPHEYPFGVPARLMDHWNYTSWRMCDGLFVHTRLLARELSAWLGEGHPPIHVSPHGTWTGHKPIRPRPLEERMKWKRLLFFGTLRRNKGLDLLLEAAESLPGFSITIAGAEHDAEYFRTCIAPQIEKLRTMGMQIDVRKEFLPEKAVGPLFAEHSAIVLPYTQQFMAQSGVAFMALAHETPIIASEVGGLRDLFSEFEIGAAFKELSAAALSTTIRNFFDHASRAEIARQLRDARDHYSWSTAAEATITGYGLSPCLMGAIG
jgi:glycosyltransferase involved in cell wall biosynthesis